MIELSAPFRNESFLLEAAMKKIRIAVFIIAVLSAMAPFALPHIKTVKATGGQLEGIVVNGITVIKMNKGWL
jgi:hypothetical protein